MLYKIESLIPIWYQNWIYRFLGLRNLSNEDLESIKERCAFNRMKVDSNANMSRFEHRRKPNRFENLQKS